MDFHIIGWLHSLPPLVICMTVLIIVGIESLGVPLPGEFILMTAALLASHGVVNPWGVWAAGATGAIVGDSIGYFFGHTYGRHLLDKLHVWFPHHFNPHTIKLATSVFHRYGARTVFFGRFVALLRIFAGPLAGILKMPYRKFLLANATGGIVWSGLAVWSVYLLGKVAEQWLSRSSWIALLATLLIGTALSTLFRRRMEQYLRTHPAED